LKTSQPHNEKVRTTFRSILRLYFAGRAGSAHEANIREWLVDDDFADEKDEALREMWDDNVRERMPDARDRASLEDMRSRLGFSPPAPIAKPRRSIRRVAARVAAAAIPIMIACGIALFVPNGGENRAAQGDLAAVKPAAEAQTERVFITETTPETEGARRHVVLPDGSEVWLEDDSRITWPEDFSEGRTVELSGKARFSVVEQNGKPFTVQGADLHITVLGTEFEFESREEEAVSEVLLIEGAVVVKHACGSYRMRPNELLTFDSATNDIEIRQTVHEAVEATIEAPAPEPALEQIRRELVFNAVPLEDVIRVLSDRYNVQFRVDDLIPLHVAVTVRFDEGESLERIMFVIANTLRVFDYTIEPGTVTLTRP
jgi:ferric-dicitrate binding protein FerR (iron transport regulator)